MFSKYAPNTVLPIRTFLRWATERSASTQRIERGDNPWFMGTVVAIAAESATIRYEDGDEASGVLVEELYYCPEGPFDNSIGKSIRFNYIKRIVERGQRGSVASGHIWPRARGWRTSAVQISGLSRENR